jgi:hypothetical protein
LLLLFSTIAEGRSRVVRKKKLRLRQITYIEPITVRGFRLTRRRIQTIRAFISSAPDFGRTAISLALCKKFNFKQPNGWPKDRAMRDILRRLHASRHIVLPASRKRGQNPAPVTPAFVKKLIDKTPIKNLSLSELHVVPAKTRQEVQLWDHLVDEHHYLGRKTIVGRNLRQIAYWHERPVACLGWSDPSLKLAPRDNFLADTFTNGWAGVSHGVNNTRFLILPWVEVHNLASKTLSLAKRNVRDYWQQYYSSELAWAETFVDPTRFIGTCYLAANWKRVGKTRGTARSGSSARRERHGISKDIFVYVFREARDRQNGGANRH